MISTATLWMGVTLLALLGVLTAEVGGEQPMNRNTARLFSLILVGTAIALAVRS